MSKHTKRRCISVILFVAYICVLVYFLFFAENMGRTHTVRSYSYNLIPLKEINRFITHRAALGAKAVWLNLAGNVAAFIPFGLFIIPVSGRKLSVGAAVLLTFDVSVFVEIIQLITKVGSFDVDDLILNTIGGIVGVLMYKLFKRIERTGSDGKAQV